jgi:hypothetical protein
VHAINQKTSDSRSNVAAALRTVFRILTSWNVKVGDWGILLGVSAATVHRWKAHPESVGNSRDLLERLSYILGIYKALQILLPANEASDSWIKRPNSAMFFDGRTPLERMMGGNMADLYEVRRWLDGQRAGS